MVVLKIVFEVRLEAIESAQGKNDRSLLQGGRGRERLDSKGRNKVFSQQNLLIYESRYL